MSNVLLVDGNNLAIRNFFTSEIQPDTDPQYQLWKYQVFTQVYWNVVNFKSDEVILAVDGADSWRKLCFSRYKEGRKKQRRDDIDWDTLFQEYNKLCNLIKQYIPFKVIKVNRAEGDDVIATLCKHIDKQCIISSTDSDFLQLSDNRVSIYNPTKKEFMKLNEPRDEFISKLCLQGQGKDNILNAKTPSDYPDELRKPPLGEKTADKIIGEGLDKFLDTHQHIEKTFTDEDGNQYTYEKRFYPRDNFQRNQILIDFENIPKVIDKTIKNVYDNYELPDPDYMYEFFKINGWNGYLDDYDIVEKTLLNLY